MPLNEDAPDAPALFRPEGTCRRWEQTPFEDWRECRRCRWSIAAVTLEQPHMKDVVDAGALWKL